MSSWEKILLKIDPSRGIPEAWQGEWTRKKIQSTKLSTMIIVILGIAFHASHHFLVDPTLELPDPTWFSNYRFASILIFGLVGILAQMSFLQGKHSVDIPASVLMFYAGIMQALSMNAFEGVPYFYMTLPTVAAALCLRWPIVQSVAYSILISGVQLAIVEGRELETGLINSLVSTTVIFVWIIRRPFSIEVQSYVTEKLRAEALNQKAELEKSFREQLQVFFPREVLRKFDLLLRGGMNPVDATSEVIALKKKFIACLHSDIRGFTKKSKDENFVVNEAAPNIQHCVDFIESYNGIPSTKGGDEIFAYFEGDIETANETAIKNALSAGFGLMEVSSAGKNSLALTPRVTRFVSITAGECMVGNIGGSYGSFNISALGAAANLSHRIDELTKNRKLLEKVTESGLFLSPDAYKAISAISDDFEIQSISLSDLGIVIRDFHELKKIFFLPCSDKNAQTLMGLELTRNLDLSAA